MRRTLRASKLLQRKTWKISITNSALRELKSLPTPTKTLVVNAITKIAGGARPDLSWRLLKMPESPNHVWEKRVDVHSRLLFTLDDDRQEASILAVISPGRISKVAHPRTWKVAIREAAASELPDRDE